MRGYNYTELTVKPTESSPLDTPGVHGPHPSQAGIATQQRLEARLGAFYGADQVFTTSHGAAVGTGGANE